jgi:hypothetical protein
MGECEKLPTQSTPLFEQVRREWNEEDREKGKGKFPLGPAAMKIISRLAKGRRSLDI